MDSHGLQRQVLIEFPTVVGIDMSITNEVVLLWVAALVTFVVVTAGCRRRGAVAHGVWGNLFESMVGLINQSVITENLGRQGRRWAPFLLTLFFFILFNNLLGLLPLPNHVAAMTGNLNVTAALAVMVFAVTVVVNIRAQGFVGFLTRFFPSGMPRALSILVMPIEVISWLARPFSLAVRLFANMTAGHALVLAFIGMAAAGSWYMKPVPLLGAAVMSGFELFVSFIQAFVFTLLTGMFIQDALETH